MLLHSGVIMQTIWLTLAWPREVKRTSSAEPPKSEVKARRCCFDFSLFLDPFLLVFVLCTALQHIAAYASVDHTPSRAVHLGGSVEEAASLVFIICLGTHVL